MKRNNEEELFIGAFDMDTGQILSEEALVELEEAANEEFIGELEGKGKPGTHKIGKVYIYLGDEGPKPHVHIRRVESAMGKKEKKPKGKEKPHDICVLLNENAYFIHGKNDGTFKTGDQKKAFRDFMEAPCSENSIESNWDYDCRKWNDSHPQCKFEQPSKMPMYNNLDKVIHEAASPIKDFR